MQVTVYPTKRSATLIAHPSAGLVSTNGSVWPIDGYTSRQLTRRLVTQNPTEAYRGEPSPMHPRVVKHLTAAAGRKRR